MAKTDEILGFAAHFTQVRSSQRRLWLLGSHEGSDASFQHQIAFVLKVAVDASDGIGVDLKFDGQRPDGWESTPRRELTRVYR